MSAAAIPDLSGFAEHFGIKVSSIGEDGDMIALGHHDKRQALAAFNAYSKTLGFPDLLDGGGQHDVREWKWALEAVTEVWAAEVHSCGECGNDPDCRFCASARAVWEQGNWWLRWDAKETDPGAFPAMHWSPS